MTNQLTVVARSEINSKMSILPLLLSELEDLRRPRLGDLYDQRFGLGLLDDETLKPAMSLLHTPLRTGYLRPWRNLNPCESGVSSIKSDGTEFKVNLDVQQFKPEELKVRVIDNFIIVEGKHEERSDEHGLVSRQFTRRYQLPADVDVSGLKSNLSSDGVLTLQAPKKGTQENKAKEIPIVQTNAPAIKPAPEQPKTPSTAPPVSTTPQVDPPVEDPAAAPHEEKKA